MIQPTSSNNPDEEQVLSGSPVNQEASSAYVGADPNQSGTGKIFSEPPPGVGVEITPDQQREIDAEMDAWDKQNQLTPDQQREINAEMDAFDKQNSPEDILYKHLTTTPSFNEFTGETDVKLTKPQALNKIVNQATYVDAEGIADPKIAEKLVIRHNVPVYSNAKDATEELGSEALFYVKPPSPEMPNGVFMNTPKRAPNAAEIKTQLKSTFEEIAEDMTPVVNEKAAAYLETPGVAGVDALHGLISLPFFADMYIPTVGTTAKLAGDLGWRMATAIPSILMYKDYYDPLFGGVEEYGREIDRSPHHAMLKKMEDIFSPMKTAIERSVGTEEAEWAKSMDTRILKLATEMFVGGTPIIKGGKMLFTPRKTAQFLMNGVRGLETLSASTALSRASVAAERAVIPKKKWLWREIDGSVGGAVAFEAAKSIVGMVSPDNPYADIIALPMMIAGAIVQPGHAIRKSYLNHTVSLYSWFWSGSKGTWRAEDTGFWNIKSPFDNPEKVEKIQKNYLRSLGVDESIIDGLAAEDNLKKQVYQMKLHKGQRKELGRIQRAFQVLKKDNPVEYEELVKRMELNFKTFTQLQEIATRNLPAGTAEKVSIYLDNLTELGQFEALRAQTMTTSEGWRFGKRVKLAQPLRAIQKNQDRLRKANVDLLKDILSKYNPDLDNTKELGKFIKFAELANTNIEVATLKASRYLEKMLEAERTQMTTAADRALIDTRKHIHPDDLRQRIRDGELDYKDAQKKIFDDIRQEDQNIINNMYREISGLREGTLDVRNLRDFLSAKLGTIGTDDVLPDDIINDITTFAKTQMQPAPIRKISEAITKNSLKHLDNSDLIDALNMLDTKAGILKVDNAGQTILKDYSGHSKDKLIGRILKEYKSEIEMFPAEANTGNLIDLMSALGKLEWDNIGTPRGRAYSQLRNKVNEYFDPDVDNFGLRVDEQNLNEVDLKKYKQDVARLKEIQEVYKKEYVPRYKSRFGKLITAPEGKGNISNEALFKQFFLDKNSIEERGESFRLFLTGMRTKQSEVGTGLKYSPEAEEVTRDFEKTYELLKFLKYGLWKRLDDGNLTAGEIDSILTTYGSKGGTQQNILKLMDEADSSFSRKRDEGLEVKLRKLQETGDNPHKVDLAEASSTINNLNKDLGILTSQKLSVLSNSGFNVMRKGGDPSDFFNTPIYFKQADFNKEHIPLYEDLLKASEKGSFGDPVESGKQLKKIIGQTLEPGEISLTPYEFLKRATNDFTLVTDGENIGEQLRKSIAQIYAKDILNESVSLTGKKLTFLDHQTGQQVMERVINYPALVKKLDDTVILRRELFGQQAADDLAHVLKNERVLAPSTLQEKAIAGLPTPLTISSGMARCFSIARGVLSLRYFLGETTIRHVRMQYVHMMHELLTNPDNPRLVMETFGTIPGSNIKSYREGVKVLGKLIGVSAPEIYKAIDSEEWRHLSITGSLSDEKRDMLFKRMETQAMESELKRRKGIARSNRPLIPNPKRSMNILSVEYGR